MTTQTWSFPCVKTSLTLTIFSWSNLSNVFTSSANHVFCRSGSGSLGILARVCLAGFVVDDFVHNTSLPCPEFFADLVFRKQKLIVMHTFVAQYRLFPIKTTRNTRKCGRNVVDVHWEQNAHNFQQEQLHREKCCSNSKMFFE